MAVLAAIAVLATALVATASVQGAGNPVAQAAARAWHSVFGDRPEPAPTSRMIVVLSMPSLAERLEAADQRPSAEKQSRWTADTEAQQQALMHSLRERGVKIRREYVFTRTLNGFSAKLDARAVAELDRHPSVVGVYPVRAVYPAQATNSPAPVGADPGIELPGFDGSGVTVALLDTGVDSRHPDLAGRVLPGFDVVDRDRLAEAQAAPEEPSRLEGHGTRMAGLLAQVAPGAKILPIRVVGWEQTSEGAAAVGRGDQLLAGLERAVDPDRDGDVQDAVRVAVAPLVEPFAAFTDSPEARAVAGATALGTLVVAPSGNDGDSGASFGAIAAPGAAPEALTVGAVDSRSDLLEVRVELRVGEDAILVEAARVLGVAGPARGLNLDVAALVGPSLADAGRSAEAISDGSELGDFFDPGGVSRVVGRAVLLPADGSSIGAKARNAAAAGASTLLVFGTDLPAGALDLDEAVALPVLALPEKEGRAAAEAVRDGRAVTVALGPATRTTNAGAGRVAPFSSGGLAFDGGVKPDIVAPGVGLATAGAGEGSPRATATGSSAASAVAAGAAALLAQARPGLTPAQLKSVLVGSATPPGADGAGDPVTSRGSGLVDPQAAAAAELSVDPAVLAFGRGDEVGWAASRLVTVTNLSSRPLGVGFGFDPDGPGEPRVSFTAEPAVLELGPGASVDVAVGITVERPLAEGASGVFVVSADGARSVRVPWALGPRPQVERPLVDSLSVSNWEFEPSASAPAVLAFRVGRASEGATGEAIEPVGILDVELWTTGGKRLGLLARLRDLLPGRYAFGLTGRGPGGKLLQAGTYVVRVRARAVDADDGTPPSTAQTVIRIKR